MLTEVTDMSASLPSPFERLLVNTNQPISVYIRLYHPTFSPASPARTLLSFPPLPSKLSLRHVSPTVKAWVDSADPSVFSNLSVLFSLNIFSAEELLALHNTSLQCEHLTVTVSELFSVPRPSDAIPLPPFPRLAHIHLTASDHDPFHGLLSFRLALQRANIPLLTHLTINNLSFQGILALRWGSFTSFGDTSWTGGNVWHGLRELDVKVVGWWHQWENAHQEREQYSEHEAQQWETEPQTSRRCKEDWRTCTRVLHDWLHSFATNGQLNTFRFQWVNSEGPNPFLLDKVAPLDGRKEWFSAPAIRWTGLRELWLGNIAVSSKDVDLMKERMAGLEKLVVPLEYLHQGLGGAPVDVDGKVWADLDVEGDKKGEWSSLGYTPSSAAAMRGSYRKSLMSEDRASMMLPFMLDIPPEDDTYL